jgi:hypothetical protein
MVFPVESIEVCTIVERSIDQANINKKRPLESPRERWASTSWGLIGEAIVTYDHHAERQLSEVRRNKAD